MQKFLVQRNSTNCTDDDLVKKYNRSVINFTKAQSESEKHKSDSDYLYKYLSYLKLCLAKEEKEALFADMKLRRLIT